MRTREELLIASRKANRKHYYKNRERLLAEQAEKRKTKKWKDRQHAYCLSRRDIQRERMRLWRAKNPERAKEYGRISSHENRAKRRGIPTRFTGVELRERYEEQCGLCAYCLKPLHGKFHADHVIPIARNGDNCIDNIVCACASCNQSKNASNILEFMQRLTGKVDVACHPT